jgi:Patatin-like phospholipase
MPRRLAITIAGAVSLGSYEAGVLYEVLEAITQHNNAVKSDGDRIEIDVLTGASAGGMTAIILAQKLMYNRTEFTGPYNNPLYNTWVERIDLKGLQDTQDDEPALHSILSSDLIGEISNELLTARYDNPAPPKADRHPALAAKLGIGVALTNLNGVAFGYPVIPDGRFTYIDATDQMSRMIDEFDDAGVFGKADRLDFWEPLRQAAVACGAFPFAFRACDVQRSRKLETEDYASPNLQDWPHDPATFTYSDGGILQNQPLGIAKNLVDLIDEHLNEESRYYLFVSPHAKDPEASDNFHAANADYLHLFERLILTIVGQAGFQDWITALSVNDRLALLDGRVEGLCNAIVKGEIGVPELGSVSKAVLGLFFLDGKHHPPGAREDETLAAAQTRIAKQYASEIGAVEVEKGPGSGDVFRDAILAFETAAGLGARDLMTIYGITATDSDLAGGGLQAFLGFFDVNFRQHDYDVGREHAQKVLKSNSGGGLLPIPYIPKTIRPIDARLDGLKLSAVPIADVQAFKAGLHKRLKQALKEWLGTFASEAVSPLADPIVDRILDYLIAKS